MMRVFLILVLGTFGLLLVGCGSSGGGSNGELVGVPVKRFKKAEIPYGMVYIPTHGRRHHFC